MNTPANIPSKQIVLIQAPLGRQENPIYPLGLATLAGAFPESWNPILADPNLSGEKHIEDLLRLNPPEIIGISLRNLDSQMRRDLFYYYENFKEHLLKIRSWAPHSVIIVGGPGFSLFPETIMTENRMIDFGISLEAEYILPDLIANLDMPQRIKGVYYWCDGKLIYTGIPDFPDAGSIPSPRYDLLDPLPYQTFGGVGLQTKRGCPMKCAYCTYPHLNGKTFRMKPVQQVLDEIGSLRKLRVEEFTFVDGIFNLPKERSVDILSQMKSLYPSVRWHGWFTEKGFDREFAQLCIDTGCREFSFSPDGYSPATLKALGKNIRVTDIDNVYKIARTMKDIKVAFNFFWNPPDQSITGFVRMICFALKCKLRLGKKAGGIIFGNPRIEPHTPLWLRAVQDGLITSETNLLPTTIKELEKTFYSNPSTRYLDWLFNGYVAAWKIKRHLLNRQ
ncbi:radical SAM protein [bacterium]|nr:radical SAM protein [candidate division CSSED10-310 bacterium]